MSAALGVAAVVLLTLATGYFVAQEFAYVAADRLRLSAEAAAGDRRAAAAVRVTERLSFMLSGAQLGITVTALVVGFIAEPALARLIAPALTALGLPAAVAPGAALALGLVLATLVQMVLGELAPKNLALARPEPLAKALAPSTLAYLAVAGPVIRLFDAAATRLLRRVGIEPVEEVHHGATLEELGHIIGESGARGALPPDLSDLLERALAFSDHTAGQVMVPRPDVVHVPGSATAAELTALVAARGHTHYPVVGERTDDVLGVVGVRELMRLAAERAADTPLERIARPALLVPETLPLPALVEQMRSAGEEFACVLDEYGGLAGIVTLEDIAEELVGEISDENDEEVVVAREHAGWWVVDAARRVDEVGDHTDLPLPEGEDYDTVAGLIVAELGRFAEPGDRLVVAADGPGAPGGLVEIEVLTVERHVPERIRLRRLAGDDAGRLVASAGEVAPWTR